MRIKALHKREGGSRHEIGGTWYHFVPEHDGEHADHVCEVANPAHAERFLSIKEGFAKAGSKRELAPAPVARSREEADDHTQLTKRHDPRDADTEEALRVEYRTLTGKPPHNKWGIERLRQRIEEFKTAQGQSAGSLPPKDGEDDAQEQDDTQDGYQPIGQVPSSGNEE